MNPKLSHTLSKQLISTRNIFLKNNFVIFCEGSVQSHFKIQNKAIFWVIKLSPLL